MAESQADIGYGFEVDVEVSPGSGDMASLTTGWFTLAETTEPTPPNSSNDVIDVTHSTSPNRTREFIQGLNDPGDMSLSMNYIPGSATDDFILDWRDSGERRKMRIRFLSGRRQSFNAFVTSYAPAIPIDDKMSADLTCKVAGSVLHDAA